MGTSTLTERLARHYRWLSLLILALTCFNLTYRLGRESVGEWDESLYATSAWEMTQSGNLVGTTFEGSLDYYNSKPPLNVWTIAAAFWIFGPGLISLRLTSAAFGWLTVWLLLRWTKGVFGPAVSLFSGLVLASTFGFLHQHAARSGNPDALLTFLILLVVVVLWHSGNKPWRRIWLGPILTGVFLLKGMAVLQPLLLIVIVEAVARPGVALASRRPPLLAAMAGFAIPVGAWLFARWHVDGLRFFERLVDQDMTGVIFSKLEGHDHSLFYYFDVLHRYHFDWLTAALLVGFVARRSWPACTRAFLEALRQRKLLPWLMVAWAVATFAVPTAMQTRVPWYLNAFYPLFVVLVGLLFAHGLESGVGRRLRTIAMVTTIVLAFVVAESRILWRVHVVTNLDTSVQGLLLDHLVDGHGQRVFRDRHYRSEAFVVRALRHADFRVMDGGSRRPQDARSGDLVVTEGEVSVAGLRLLGQADGHSVYQVESMP